MEAIDIFEPLHNGMRSGVYIPKEEHIGHIFLIEIDKDNNMIAIAQDTPEYANMGFIRCLKVVSCNQKDYNYWTIGEYYGVSGNYLVTQLS